MDILTRHTLWLGTSFTLFALLLSACGGGGGHSSTPSYSSASSSMPMSSSMSSSSMSSSSVSSSSTSLAALPITDALTAAGGTFVAKGQAEVLINTNGTISAQQQTKTGLSLYVFDEDATGVSSCVSAQCMTAWPPLAADNNAVAAPPFTLITRADGNQQWALHDKPLYFYMGDVSAGDINGEGLDGVWHTALLAPVQQNRASINAADGDYLTALGSVSLGLPVNGSSSNFGSEWHDRDNFALYIFDDDTLNTSNCTGNCLVIWPPLLADAGDKAVAPYSIIDRVMGTGATAKQWAYQGLPLYFYAGDTTVADTLGKAIPKWHLARPLPTIVQSSTQVGSYLAAAGLVKTAEPLNSSEQITSLAHYGFALYSFDMDTAGVSTCNNACLSTWPALMASDGAVATAPFSLVARSSGKLQWALNGMPLYLYSGDTHAGQPTGDGVAGVWHLARSAPVALSNNPSKGVLFIGHGKLLKDTGAADSAHTDFTLYTFDSDPMGATSCFGSCLSIWPALYAPVDAKAFGDFTVVVRDANTGVKQWAYKGKPLYFYSGDSQAGNTLGDYPGWTIARPN